MGADAFGTGKALKLLLRGRQGGTGEPGTGLRVKMPFIVFAAGLLNPVNRPNPSNPGCRQYCSYVGLKSQGQRFEIAPRKTRQLLKEGIRVPKLNFAQPRRRGDEPVGWVSMLPFPQSCLAGDGFGDGQDFKALQGQVQPGDGVWTSQDPHAQISWRTGSSILTPWYAAGSSGVSTRHGLPRPGMGINRAAG